MSEHADQFEDEPGDEPESDARLAEEAGGDELPSLRIGLAIMEALSLRIRRLERAASA